MAAAALEEFTPQKPEDRIDDESTYTAPEVARLLGVDLRTVQRWARDGFAPATKKTPGGGRRRYTARDLQRARMVQVMRAPGCGPSGKGFRGEELRRVVAKIMGALPREAT